MGRGAGNLNTELLVEYLNDNIGTSYTFKPLLTIIDEILNPFYQQNYWGYSLPNYLSAKHNTHPDYAGYLDAKKTLTVENMDEIFSMMDDAKRVNYDKEYIECLLYTSLDQDWRKNEMMNDTSKLEESTLLTIAIPTYNGARTIGNMLDILLPQINDQVEVLIVDNCSTDNTPQIVKKYMERYNKISYNCLRK